MKKEDNIWIAMPEKCDGCLAVVEAERPERACMLVFTSRKKILNYLDGEGINSRIKKLSWGQAVTLAIKEGLDIRVDRVDGGYSERHNIGRMLADMKRVQLSYN